MSDKRKHPRFSVDLPVEYYKIGSIVKHNGRAINASQGGLLLHFSEPLQIGQYLRLKFFLPSGFRLSAIETIAEVTWINTQLGEGEEHYRSGVRFINMSPKDVAKLNNFSASLS